MPARLSAAVGARASSDERVANHSTSWSLILSHGGLPITASKPPCGRTSCHPCQTPGKAASQCRNRSRSAMALASLHNASKSAAEASMPPGPSARSLYASLRVLFEEVDKRRLERGARLLGHPGGEPAQPAQEVEQAAHLRRRLLHSPEQRRRLPHLGHVGVGHLLDPLHPAGRVLRSLYRAAGEEAAQPPQLLDAALYPHAYERVAAAQVMVEERQRRADGEAVEPQRHLRQLHRQRVLVHAVDAPLQHHPPDDRLVGQLRRVHHPVGLTGPLEDVPSDRRYPLHQRRHVLAVEPLRVRRACTRRARRCSPTGSRRR